VLRSQALFPKPETLQCFSCSSQKARWSGPAVIDDKEALVLFSGLEVLLVDSDKDSLYISVESRESLIRVAPVRGKWLLDFPGLPAVSMKEFKVTFGSSTCTVCLGAEARYLMPACGHLLYCRQCRLAASEKCPLCSKPSTPTEMQLPFSFDDRLLYSGPSQLLGNEILYYGDENDPITMVTYNADGTGYVSAEFFGDDPDYYDEPWTLEEVERNQIGSAKLDHERDE
jgi:RNA polymerase subunit RPABC4/transcription elongation factor Spt4